MASLKFIICSSEFAGQTSNVYMKPGDQKHLYTENDKLAYEQSASDMPSPKHILAELQDELGDAAKTHPQSSTDIVVILSPCGVSIGDYAL